MAQPLSFGERLEALLNGLEPPRTQAWLADKAGLERSTISRIIRGERNLTIETAQYIAPALTVTIDELVRGTDAEGRLQEASQFIKRVDYDSAIHTLVGYEGRINDLEVRLRASAQHLGEEQRRREKVERELLDSHVRFERLQRDLDLAKTQYEMAEGEVRRHRDALNRAVGQILTLQEKLRTLAEELKATSNSSKAAAILAGIAALTSMVTAATFLGTRSQQEEAQENKSKAKSGRSKK